MNRSGFDNSCKKSMENECNRYEFSDQKVHNYGLYLGWFEIGLPNHIRTD
jgi:hypothetical protein